MVSELHYLASWDIHGERVKLRLDSTLSSTIRLDHRVYRKSSRNVPIQQKQNRFDSPSEVATAICQAWPCPAWTEVHVAVAISGGCDSMALLRAMLELKEQHGGTGQLSALHVNHHLRGADSDADSDWCSQQCAMLEVPLIILSGKATERAQTEGDGIEAAARNERYELLTLAAENAGIRFLVTAHTRNDQVETVLFRLLRGSGLQGLRGIPRSRQLSGVVTLVRPLLECSRETLQSYLEALGQAYRNDSSNQELRFSRNRIRHQLLPTLRAEHNQDVDAALLRLAAQADETQQFVELHARKLLGDANFAPPVGKSCLEGNLSLDLRPFSEQADIVVCEALRLVWREEGLPEQAMTYDWWQKMTKLAKSASETEVLNLPGNVRASVDAGCLVLKW